MIIFLIIVSIIVVFIFAFFQQMVFGRLPSGKRMERIRRSPQFHDGAFANSSYTPQLTEGANLYSVMREFLFERNPRGRPKRPIPAVRTDLRNLDLEKDFVVWFGHSSYFLQLEGKRLLVDPVLSGAASPIAATTRSFPGSDVFALEDLPDIDLLIITHDHFDHLDYKTVSRLKSRVRQVVCSLGTGAHLERWAFDPENIIETDWHESLTLNGQWQLITTPARHFSGRTLKRNQSIWNSYVLKTTNKTLYLGGDSGYDTHFKSIGDQFGPFDLAILECGQYDRNWKYIHMLPEEVLQAARDLQAKWLMPVHWGKFQLANHAWDDPIRRLLESDHEKAIPLLTPRIGEAVDLDDTTRKFDPWWSTVD